EYRYGTEWSGPTVWWALPAAVLLFGLFEFAVFNVHLRGEPVSVSLSEVPTALAAAFLTPGLGVVARIPLSLAVLVLLRRNAYFKVAFNLALFAFEVVMVSLVYHVLVDWWGDAPAARVGAATVSVAAVGPTALILVSA